MTRSEMSTVLFLQNRASRGGAQTSLARLLETAAVRAIKPVLVCGEAGWLSRHCEEAGVAVQIHAHPRSRSLSGRLWSNRAFAQRLTTEFQKLHWVIANDHQDGLLAHAVATAAGIPWAIILRASGMTRRDFEKYRCGEAARIFAVGHELHDAACSWTAPSRVVYYREGLADSEFLPAKPFAAQFPTRLLIAGNESPGKGWDDLLAALEKLEALATDVPSLDLDFTGGEPKSFGTRPERLKHRMRFLGRVDNFAELVRGYDFVLHPSRHESFGLAPLEILAAGVPVLCGATGAVTKIGLPQPWLFPPGNAPALAERLLALIQNWRESSLPLETLQARIRRDFSASVMGQEFVRCLNSATVRT